MSERLKALGYPEAACWQQCRLVAVSKYAPAEAILEAYGLGLRCFGESRPVEALRKRALLPPAVEADCEWHFLGHLQRNKLGKVLQGQYTLIHSVHSESLLAAMQAFLEQHPPKAPQAFLLQVNLTGEASKQGFLAAEVEALIPRLTCDYPSLRCEGLMTMAALHATEAETQATFEGLTQLQARLCQQFNLSWQERSMGMSGDVALAQAAGATLVRLGQALFGEARFDEPSNT